MPKLIADLIGTKISGWLRKCPICGRLFLGRKDAEFCSDRCRVAAHRERKDQS